MENLKKSLNNSHKDYKIYAVNFADSNFEKQRKYNTKTAYINGKVDYVIEYNLNDIDKKFKDENKEILSISRGCGLWIWKAYFIIKALNNINYGDYLIYTDSGVTYIDKVEHLIKTMIKDNVDIMTFELPLLQRQFTKKETFYLMDFHEYNHNQILAGYIIVQKTDKSINVIKEWLHWMKDIRILSGKHFLEEVDEFTDFVEHREDQSVLSVVCRKNGIIPYRDPSEYGIRSWEYKGNSWSYNPKLYSNSPYPKILLSNRKVHPIKYYIIELIKNILFKIGIYNEKIYCLKNKIKM